MRPIDAAHKTTRVLRQTVLIALATVLIPAGAGATTADAASRFTTTR
ncbi:MAG: hypothetical protein IPJ61_07005 [Tessaracoccus sp.]|nr:hypothetical protein [Tessaracoccus sp.]MBK7820821.1 hypothetical protein [Tessaracoccus sp.]